MTDGTQNSQAAGVTAAEEYVVEGDGAPAPVVADEQSGKGQAGETDAQAEQKGAGPAKAAATPDPENQSKRDRIQQLIRENKAATAFGVAAMEKARVLEQRLAALGQPAAGETPEATMTRVISHGVTAERATMVKEQVQEAQQRAADLSRQAWEEHTADTRAKHADFEAVVNNPNLTITPLMAETLREEENGGEIAYYLGKNPQEAERISRLGYAAQVRELAKLGDKFEEVAKPGAAATQAPPPPKTVSGTSGGSGKDPEAMSFEEYRAWRGLK